MDRIYIVKNLTPWMLDELKAFSLITSYKLVLLRQQDSFYDDYLKELRVNGVKILVEPNSRANSIKKILFLINFILINFSKFFTGYNFVIGMKSIYWFYKIDLKYFSENSNIHAQFATQSALVSVLIKKYYNDTPSISFTFHAYDIYFQNSWFNYLALNSHIIFSISDFNIQYVKDKYGLLGNIKLSRLGVFRPKMKLINNRFSEKDSIGNRKLKIGLISWFVEKKGIIFLLKALKELKNKGLNFTFKLAGDGPLKKQYLDFIRENDLDDVVEYIGKVKGEEKQLFFSSLDLFILPSIKLKNDQDGIPVVLMEAISNGLPIMSTNVSGIPEICIDEFNGKLLEEQSVDDIIKGLSEIEMNRSDLINYSSNSLKLSSQYDILINSKEKMIALNWIKI